MPDDQSTDASANADQSDASQQQQNDDDDKGKGGKDAILADLASERDRRQAAEKAAKAATDRLAALEKQHMTDAERAVAKAKEEGRAEALTTANERLLRAEVRAAAAGKLADPNLAMKLLDLSTFEVDANGDVDSKAISKAVDALVKQYPALAATNGHGSGDGGARQGAPPDMNALIRARMNR